MNTLKIETALILSMKRLSFIALLLSFLVLILPLSMSAQMENEFIKFDKTLRLNYVFTGGINPIQISLSNLGSYEGWWGRRYNLDKLPVQGNGKIYLRDSASSKLLYINSFSTLFSEWLTTDEAKRTNKAFENVFLVPMPLKKAEVTIELYGVDNSPMAVYTQYIDPGDILIKPYTVISETDAQVGDVGGIKYKYIHRGGSSKECIDVVIVSEGYTKEQEDKFYSDCTLSAEEILKYEPFNTYRNRFNFVALFVESKESGVSIPGKQIWKETALGSQFNTFYMDRYLTTLNLFKLHDYISVVPYEHIIILANTANYGGGGIYNSYILSAVDNSWHKPVVVHEFGHSFGALADEYFYDDGVMNQYKPGIEPWEPNITTLANFESKWKDMLSPDYKIVTKQMQGKDYLNTLKAKDYKVGVYEGGGYQSQGVYRPFPTCRMRDNRYPTFCPVCERAIKSMILFNTEEL